MTSLPAGVRVRSPDRESQTSPWCLWCHGNALACDAPLFPLLFDRPLFCGFSEVQQLQKIIEVIGLPVEAEWPVDSPVLHFVAWRSEGTLNQLLPNLNPDEWDLLLVIFHD
ncbi:cyclin-dependent kinase 6 [Arapaima gigas]